MDVIIIIILIICSLFTAYSIFMLGFTLFQLKRIEKIHKIRMAVIDLFGEEQFDKLPTYDEMLDTHPRWWNKYSGGFDMPTLYGVIKKYNLVQV